MRYHFTKRTKEDLFKSIEISEQAVKLDPKFALAYVGIAESWTVIPSFPYASPAECIPKAKAAAEKALELDPELPEAHTVSAMIAATYDWDWGRAEAGFKRALELDPNASISHYRYAWTYLSPIGTARRSDRRNEDRDGKRAALFDSRSKLRGGADVCKAFR